MKAPLPKWLLISFVVFFIRIEAHAQTKEFETRYETWLAYFNQTRFTNKSGLWLDLHLRMTDNFIERIGTTILRPGYTYYLSDQVRLTAGYAYVTFYSPGDIPNLHEHRPWQQIQWFDQKSWYTQMQWLRLEQRFRQKFENGQWTGDYNFNYRIRYNFAMSIPLKGKVMGPKVPFIFLSDELHINFGEEIVYNYFDQNRLVVSSGYQFTQGLNMQVGYMYLFQQLPAGNRYIHNHSLRIFLFQNIDWRSKN